MSSGGWGHAERLTLQLLELANCLPSGIWLGDWSAPDLLSPIQRAQTGSSDVISFHNYGIADDFAQRVKWLKAMGRPLLRTEYMARPAASTFQTILPVAKEHEVGTFCWGLVRGKTQTHLPWDKWENPNPSQLVNRIGLYLMAYSFNSGIRSTRSGLFCIFQTFRRLAMAEEPSFLSEEDDRRRFLKTCGSFAVTVPPALTVLLSTSLSSEAIARSTGGGGGHSGGPDGGPYKGRDGGPFKGADGHGHRGPDSHGHKAPKGHGHKRPDKAWTKGGRHGDRHADPGN